MSDEGDGPVTVSGRVEADAVQAWKEGYQAGTEVGRLQRERWRRVAGGTTVAAMALVAVTIGLLIRMLTQPR